MTDERIDLIGSVALEPLWCEPCYVRLGIMDGTAALARLGESAS